MIRKILSLLLLFLCLAIAQSFPKYSIKESGTTRIFKEFNGRKVKIEIIVAQQNLENRPYEANDAFLNTKILIFVDEKSLFIPSIILYDLKDLHYADLSIDIQMNMRLFIIGGDGIETYSKEIIFNDQKVIKEVVYSDISKKDTSSISIFLNQSRYAD